jgi:membrane-associated phospholipid phosphatase
VARNRTSALDIPLRRVSRAADHSKLWIATAAVRAATGGRDGRRAGVAGLVCVALTSTLVNGAIKPLARRPRPDRTTHAVPLVRCVPMPTTASLPSGHAASAFAFAAGAGGDQLRTRSVLHAMAAVVAYSRVHVGVHFPGDVACGALVGATVARLATRAVAGASR